MARMQVRYLASDEASKARFFGNCPKWAAEARKRWTVTTEHVLSHGTPRHCAICGGSHIDVPPPWDPTA